jgi:hypothetical protein
VLCKENVIYTSTKNGVAPLIEWLTNDINITGFSAADKIVGKAAALLFVLGGVREVYSPVMSETAVDVFTRYGIATEYETLVPIIINRTGTGPCPMEQAVTNIENPSEALKAIQNTLADLQSRGKERKQ